jgi:predicted RNase H-like nuclease (RuvC/YqgF family)
MAKYKNITESMIDKFISKVFKKAFDQNMSSTIKKLKKQDPDLADALDDVDKTIKNYKKKLSKMSPEQREKQRKKARDFIRKPIGS